MNEILDHDDSAPEVSYASRAFIYFKWIAVFFTACLMTSYFQRKNELDWRLADVLIILFLVIAFLLSFPCLKIALSSFSKKEPIGYRNLISVLASLGMMLFFVFVVMVNLLDILSFLNL